MNLHMYDGSARDRGVYSANVYQLSLWEHNRPSCVLLVASTVFRREGNQTRGQGQEQRD